MKANHDVTKISRQDLLVYQIELTNVWWKRYSVELKAKVGEDGFVRLEMHEINSSKTLLWKKTCPVGDETLFPSLMRLANDYERIREFRQLQGKAEKVLGLKDMHYGPLTISSTGHVSLIFEQEDEPPLPSFLHDGLDERGRGTAGYYIRLYLTEAALRNFRRWIDREEARQLMTSKLKYLTNELDASVQIWDDRVVINISVDVIHRSLECEMTVKGVNELLKEVEKIRKST